MSARLFAAVTGATVSDHGSRHPADQRRHPLDRRHQLRGIGRVPTSRNAVCSSRRVVPATESASSLTRYVSRPGTGSARRRRLP